MVFSEVLPKLLKGLLGAAIIFLLTCLITAIIYNSFTSFNRALGASVLLVGYYLAIFSGGLGASRKAASHGWLLGLVVGLFISLLTMICGKTSLLTDFSFFSVFRLLTSIASGILGGIIGINLKKVP